MLKKVFLIHDRIDRSFRYDSWVNLFLLYLAFIISFKANSNLLAFISTLHTFPKPPFPITYRYLKECLPITRIVVSKYYTIFFWRWCFNRCFSSSDIIISCNSCRGYIDWGSPLMIWLFPRDRSIKRLDRFWLFNCTFGHRRILINNNWVFHA